MPAPTSAIRTTPMRHPANILFLSDRPDKLATGTQADHRGMPRAPRLDQHDPVQASAPKRKQPRLDDKVLLGWNGLMIAAMARAGAALAEPRFTHAATSAADFALKHLRDSSGNSPPLIPRR
jgi:uncharacterized protein YyaL (SSP411 family)